jgi:chromosome segregation ATPase
VCSRTMLVDQASALVEAERERRVQTMSSDATRKGSGQDAESPTTAPVAPDRPVVDGTAKTPDEIRAEIAELSDERLQHVEEVREELAESIEEIAARLDVPARMHARKDATVAEIRARGNELIASTQQQLDRAFRIVASIVRERPVVVAAAGVVLLIVLSRRRR